MNIKTCKICDLTIYVLSDHFLRLVEMRSGNEICTSYYHANCYLEKISVQRQMKSMLNMLGFK